MVTSLFSFPPAATSRVISEASLSHTASSAAGTTTLYIDQDADQESVLIASQSDDADVFEIVGVYDFDYEIDEPRRFDNDLTDALFVLQRR